jgi:hypothetical protein
MIGFQQTMRVGAGGAIRLAKIVLFGDPRESLEPRRVNTWFTKTPGRAVESVG